MFWRVLAPAALLSGFQLAFFLSALSWPPGLTILGLLATNGFLLYLFARRLLPGAPRSPQEYPIPGADSTLQIASETLPYLRRGLNEETAKKTVEIIQKISEVAAVALTDRERVLSYLGVGCERHQPGDRILTEATKEVLATGQFKVVQTSSELNCPVQNCDCPLGAAVIVPLVCRGEVAGTLKLYQTTGGCLPPYVIRLAIGIGQLLSMQIELAELDRQTQLATLAELNALQAQINPHFFFNTLNTIIMYSRTNPQRARRLLLHLAEFFRHRLKQHGHFTTLHEELDSVHTYLVLEKARFGKKLQIIQDIDKELLEYQVPGLSLQPLVENAVKHGLAPKAGGGAVKIQAFLSGEGELLLKVSDDGVGIPKELQPLVLFPGHGSGNGVGLSNVQARLKGLYGEPYGLIIESREGKGTTITMRIPCPEVKVRENQQGA